MAKEESEARESDSSDDEVEVVAKKATKKDVKTKSPKTQIDERATDQSLIKQLTRMAADKEKRENDVAGMTKPPKTKVKELEPIDVLGTSLDDVKHGNVEVVSKDLKDEKEASSSASSVAPLDEAQLKAIRKAEKKKKREAEAAALEAAELAKKKAEADALAEANRKLQEASGGDSGAIKKKKGAKQRPLVLTDG
jgi:hypothetical protein